jgi:hypothetical protein
MRIVLPLARTSCRGPKYNLCWPVQVATRTLYASLCARCRQLAQAQRLKGKVPPTYLTEAIELMGPPGELPTNPKTALEKAKQWVASFQQPVTGSAQPPEVLRAYRKEGELSEKDKHSLNTLEEKFKRGLTEKKE